METALGIGALVLIFGFILFAFRQGMKVKNPPENVPQEDVTILTTARNVDNVNRL